LSFNVPLSHDLFPNMQGTEPVDNKLSKFLVSEFLINPEKGIRSRYKSTASIVDLMMNPEGHKCKSPVFSYPSCAMNRALKVESNGVVNLAWDPQFAKESLEIESLRRVTMEWDTGWKIGSNLSKTTKKAGINVREKGVILSSGAVEWKL
uniref:hypothetical protein n=1 Tax=Vibrio campbellii TaxID=680 RepID=UPI000A513DB1